LSERKHEIRKAFEGLGDKPFLDPYVDAVENPDSPRAQKLLRVVPEPIRRDIELLARARKGSARREAPQAPAPMLAQVRNGRPNELTGVTKKLTTGHGPMYVTLNDDEFGPRECFVILGKPGGTAAAFSDALGRMISLAMTHGAPPEGVVKQLRGIQDGHPAGFGFSAILSVPDGVAKAMAEYYLSDGSAGPAQAQLPIVGSCPECSGELSHESGCAVCHSCGWVPEAKKSGLRFRALLDGGEPEICLATG
jgi:ribonucleoside-diphosphate reductase alpha chain